jgi:hypothetical protein
LVDFFVTNCGAGSVTVALATGCPQLCHTTGIVGAGVGQDKVSNEKVISKDLIVGPIAWMKPPTLPSKQNRNKGGGKDAWSQSKGMLQISFGDFMDDIEENLEIYRDNAEKVALFVTKEQKEMFQKVGRFFELLSQSAILQQNLNVHQAEGHSHIPLNFALSECEPFHYQEFLRPRARQAVGDWSKLVQSEEGDLSTSMKKQKL